MLLWLSWINKIFSIKYHGVTRHTWARFMFIMYHTYPCQTAGKHEVIHKEFSDLFPQPAQTWQTWGYNAYTCNDETPWKHFLHLAFLMESFDLPNPLHWCHMSAMASRIIGNSTDCSAASPGKTSKKTKCPYYRPFVRGIHQSLVFPITKEQ